MNLDAAVTIALKALGFLANQEDALLRFLAISGADAAELRARAEEPEFLASVLDFLLADDALLTSFCDSESVDAKAVHLARHKLGGA